MMKVLVPLAALALVASCSSSRSHNNEGDSSDGANGEAGTDAAPGKWSGNAVTPEVKREAFQVDGGTWLNAFYFVRAVQEGDKSKAESWEAVSQAIYGSPEKAAQLKTWNPELTRLSVGAVVYYNSPTRPTDNAAMKVYAEDRGLALEQFEVKKGDTLSEIGKQRYGDYRSWKEIAALNPELKSPNQIAPGTVLRLQPPSQGGGDGGAPAGGAPAAGGAPETGMAASAPAAPAQPAAAAPTQASAPPQQQQQQQNQGQEQAAAQNGGSQSAENQSGESTSGDREPASAGGSHGMVEKLKAQFSGMNTMAMAGAGLALAGLLTLLALKLRGRLNFRKA